jgi:hypothetical protein
MINQEKSKNNAIIDVHKKGGRVDDKETNTSTQTN